MFIPNFQPILMKYFLPQMAQVLPPGALLPLHKHRRCDPQPWQPSGHIHSHQQSKQPGQVQELWLQLSVWMWSWLFLTHLRTKKTLSHPLQHQHPQPLLQAPLPVPGDQAPNQHQEEAVLIVTHLMLSFLHHSLHSVRRSPPAHVYWPWMRAFLHILSFSLSYWKKTQ